MHQNMSILGSFSIYHILRGCELKFCRCQTLYGCNQCSVNRFDSLMNFFTISLKCHPLSPSLCSLPLSLTRSIFLASHTTLVVVDDICLMGENLVVAFVVVPLPFLLGLAWPCYRLHVKTKEDDDNQVNRRAHCLQFHSLSFVPEIRCRIDQLQLIFQTAF